MIEMHNTPDTNRYKCRNTQHDIKFLLSLLAKFITPGKKINLRHQPKLLNAKPQATINEGASLLRVCAGTFEDTDIFANGLAIIVGTPTVDCTTSCIPGIDAQPPARTRLSILAIWLDEKKNCCARLICCAMD